VTNNHTAMDVLNPGKKQSFPKSVVEMMEGHLGTPQGGWPKVLQKIMLDSAGEKPLKGRPGEILPKVDFKVSRKELSKKIGREPHDDGTLTVFYELNGLQREVKLPDRSLEAAQHRHPKADPDDPNHVAAPMPGKVSTVAVKKGDAVKNSGKLLSIEAMKMETA